MAGQALERHKSENSPEDLPTPATTYDILRRHCAKLYGQGWKRTDIARAMVKHLVPNESREMSGRLRTARQKLGKWEKQEAFRDMVWEEAVAKLDLQTPAILNGVARSARRGRVDAAKLALEITGRHVTKGDQVAPNISIAFESIPRPGPLAIADAEVVDADE